MIASCTLHVCVVKGQVSGLEERASNQHSHGHRQDSDPEHPADERTRPVTHMVPDPSGPTMAGRNGKQQLPKLSDQKTWLSRSLVPSGDQIGKLKISGW